MAANETEVGVGDGLSRRGFLAGSLGATAAAGTALKARHIRLPGSTHATDRTTARPSTKKVAGPLVLCTLYGGNDGLNTVVPYEEPAYHALRKGLAITHDEALPIGAADGVTLGLHPSLTGMQALWNSGHLAIILGVEYPNPNYSHFESMDIWQTADLSGEAGSGWLGRWLDATGTDPMRALSVGSQVPIAFAGNVQQAGTLADSTQGNAQLPYGNGPFTSAYKELMSLKKHQGAIADLIAADGTNLLHVGNEAAKALNKESVPPGLTDRYAADIGNQLDIAAELIEYGLPTQAYGVSFASFDTHSNQAGTHATLLSQLDAAVQNFCGVFPTAEAGKNPVLVIYSEFGRRPEANASAGTDHSSASVVFVVGPSVKGGYYGAMPSLTKFDEYGNFVVTTDFRSVYATILEQVLGIDNKSVLGKSFRTIDFL
ncbi:MAG: DUF1501 domain-containing protein [Acidimicrobiales bacterium]